MIANNHPDLSGLRILAVHAHPDDEALWTGGLLAHASRRGADVRVLTCTLGEEGEVIGEPFQGLVAGESDQLGGYRIAELRESLQILGVNGPDHQPMMLGGYGRFRDSGMAGTPSAQHPRAFVRSGQAAVDALAEVLRAFHPDVVVTYGPDGGYGHPDHIRAHEITHQAVAQVGGCRDLPVPGGLSVGGKEDFLSTLRRTVVGAPSARPAAILWAVTGESALKSGLAAITQIPSGWRRPDSMAFSFSADAVGTSANPEAQPELAFVPDDAVDLVCELGAVDVAAKRDAMAAHATQLWIADGRVSYTNPHAAYALSDPGAAPVVFALSNLIAQPFVPVEQYIIGAGAVPGWDTSVSRSFESTVTRGDDGFFAS